MSSLTVEIRSYSGEAERHRHDFHQVILPYSGGLEIEIDRHAGRVAGSIASFVLAGRDHTFNSDPENAFIVMDVPIGTGPTAIDSDLVPPFFAVGPDILGLVDYMVTASPSAPLSSLLLSAWSILLLNRLVEQEGHPDRAELAVRSAISFMKLRLAERIRVGDIAEATGLSTTRLHDAFVKKRSTTPHAQLVALRLDAAERMLGDPSLSIAEIAIRSGHADQSTLTRIMRRERGATPAEVRHSLLGGSGGNA